MAPHSRVLAWRIPGTGEPGGLPSLGSQRVGHDWSDLAAAAAAALHRVPWPIPHTNASNSSFLELWHCCPTHIHCHCFRSSSDLTLCFSPIPLYPPSAWQPLIFQKCKDIPVVCRLKTFYCQIKSKLLTVAQKAFYSLAADFSLWCYFPYYLSYFYSHFQQMPKLQFYSCARLVHFISAFIHVALTMSPSYSRSHSSMEYYSAIKKNKIMPFTLTWMDLEIVISSEVSQRKPNMISLIYEV